MVYLLLFFLYYNFYKRKNKKLTIASQSAGRIAVFYSMLSGFNLATMIFASKKAKKAKDILNKKSLLLA